MILVSVVGLLAFAVASSTFPIKDSLLSSINPKPASFAASGFVDTYDLGSPTSPLRFGQQSLTNQRYDLVAGGQDGQVVTSDPGNNPSTPIEAGHGPGCQAPIGNSDSSLNNHLLQHSDSMSMGDWQNNVRPQVFYVCNNHMMTAVKSGYSVASFMPRYIFDFAGRTGNIQFDTNPYAFSREWWDLYIVPAEDMLINIEQIDEGGTGELLPKQGVLFSMNSGQPQIDVIENYEKTYKWRYWQSYAQAFPDDPALNDPKVRRTFKFSLSQTNWTFELQKADGSFWKHSGTFDKPLPFSNGLVKVEHHSYNPTKEGIQGSPWSQYTYHWDNFIFDGPAPADHFAYVPDVDNADIGGPSSEPGGPAIKVNVTNPEIKNAVLVGQVNSQLNIVDSTNTSHWRQFRINGGAWQDLTLVKNISLGSVDRKASSFRNSLTDVKVGENVIEFRQASRPGGASWQSDGFDITDVEIRVAPTSDMPSAIFGAINSPAPYPTTTPTATTAPVATPTPTATATPTPTPTSTPVTGAGGVIPTPTPTATPTPTLTPTATPTATPTPTTAPVIPTSTPQPSVAEVPCTLSSAKWLLNQNPVIEGSKVSLTVNTSGNCTERLVSFLISENDGLFGTNPVSNNPLPVLISNNSATIEWVAEYQQDGFFGFDDPPEYYFEAKILGTTQSIKSADPELKVTKATTATQGSSVLFNGSNSFAQAPNHSELNTTGDWTVEGWFKDESTDTFTKGDGYNHPLRYILIKGNTDRNSEASYLAAIGFNKLSVGLRNGWRNQTLDFDLKQNNISFNMWHHFAVTFQASTKRVTLYIDGTKAAEKLLTASSKGNNLPLSIGRNGNQHYFKGKLDEIRVWNVLRTPVLVRASYENGLIGAQSGLVGYWRLDEGSGNSSKDETTPAQNLNLSNTSWSSDVH